MSDEVTLQTYPCPQKLSSSKRLRFRSYHQGEDWTVSDSKLNVKLNPVRINMKYKTPLCVCVGEGQSGSSSNRATERGALQKEWGFIGVLRIARKPFWRSHKSRRI